MAEVEHCNSATAHVSLLGMQKLKAGQKLYAHADPSEVERLRAGIAASDARARVFATGTDILQRKLESATQRADAAERKLGELEHFLPTPEATNALPEGIRRYVRDLHTLCDPSGIVAENTMLRDQTKQLNAMIGRLKRELSEAVGLLREGQVVMGFVGMQDHLVNYDLAGDVRAKVSGFLSASAEPAMCDTCHGQGEVWTSENQSFGYMSMQPPEPIMEACPECGGESEPAKGGDGEVQS